MSSPARLRETLDAVVGAVVGVVVGAVASGDC